MVSVKESSSASRYLKAKQTVPEKLKSRVDNDVMTY